ncbi:polysaccharide biosynthesis tyrosine autokinase [candidate division KSB1 bacterium]|nr:polysaccharide biosynthesis tyrosine autokinase [candidate division KSB1 bacterium]
MPSSNLKKNSRVWSRQDYAFFWYQQKWFIVIVFLAIVGIFYVYSLSIPRYYSSKCVFVWDRIDLQNDNHTLPVIQTNPSPALYRGLVGDSFKERLLGRIIEKYPKTAEREIKQIRQEINEKLFFDRAEPKNSAFLKALSHSPELAFTIVEETLDLLDDELDLIRENEIQKVAKFLNTKKEYLLGKIQSIDEKIAVQKQQNRTNINSGRATFPIQIQNIEKKLADTCIERELAESNLMAYRRQLNAMSLEMAESPFEESPLLLEQRKRLDQLIEKRNRFANQNYSPEALRQLDQEIEQQKQKLIELTLNRSISKPGDLYNIHPSVIQELKKKSLQQELNLHVLKGQERLYKRLLNERKFKVPEQSREIHKLAQLQNTRSIYNQLYSSILKELEDLTFILQAQPENLRVIHAAVVPKTSIPLYRSRLLTLGIYLGLLIAIALALLRHHSKTSLKNEIDVIKETEYPLLGVIPRADLKNSDYQKLEDTFTSICMKLYLQPHQSKMNSILLTSALQGEGKSFCAVNFFINCAKLGKRVLLIDTNLRNPRLHNIFEVNSYPGLSDFVFGKSSLQTAAKKIHKNNSILIPAGRQVENPISVLSHSRMKELLHMGATRFDLVILDAAHILLTASDPLILSKLVSHTLMVVRRGETRLEIIKKAISSLQQMDIDISGIILNDIVGNNHYDRAFTSYQKKQRKFFAPLSKFQA